MNPNFIRDGHQQLWHREYLPGNFSSRAWCGEVLHFPVALRAGEAVRLKMLKVCEKCVLNWLNFENTRALLAICDNHPPKKHKP